MQSKSTTLQPFEQKSLPTKFFMVHTKMHTERCQSIAKTSKMLSPTLQLSSNVPPRTSSSEYSFAMALLQPDSLIVVLSLASMELISKTNIVAFSSLQLLQMATASYFLLHMRLLMPRTMPIGCGFFAFSILSFNHMHVISCNQGFSLFSPTVRKGSLTVSTVFSPTVYMVIVLNISRKTSTSNSRMLSSNCSFGRPPER